MIFSNIIFVFLISVLTPNIIFGQTTPSISYSQPQSKYIGDTVELNCNVQEAYEDVVWARSERGHSDSRLLSINNLLITHNSRFSIKSSPTNTTLKIKNLKANDAGVYECQAIYSATNIIKAKMSVVVKYQPMISDNFTKSILVLEGESVQMECFAAGFPIPSIQWHRENNDILSTGGSTYSGNVLKINSARIEDRGRYHCVANNDFGKTDKRNVDLEVESAPVIRVPQSSLDHQPITPMCSPNCLPSISYITQQQTKDIGASVELKCSVENLKDYSVVWTKTGRDRPDSVFLSTGSAIIIKDSRFSILYDPSSSTYNLQIKDIQETDAGIYECQVIVSVINKIKAEVDVRVRYQPIIYDNSTQSLVANEGKSVQMECFAAGLPTPTIQWYRENNAILPTGGNTYSGNVLKINSVGKDDRGRYYCVADNGVGKSVKRNVDLEVEFAPVITVFRPSLGHPLQNDVVLECYIEAFPPPAITWFKDGIQLKNNQQYSISHFAIDEEFNTNSTISIKTVEKKDFGDYYCKAANKLGQAEAKVNLFEEINPLCSSNCISYITQQQTKDIDESVELKCTVENPRDFSFIMWVKKGLDYTDTKYLTAESALIIKDSRFSINILEEDQINSTTYTLKINDMIETDSGVYQCMIFVSPINQITADVEVRVKPSIKTPTNDTDFFI